MKNQLLFLLGILFFLNFASAVSVSNSNLILNDTINSIKIQFNQVENGSGKRSTWFGFNML